MKSVPLSVIILCLFPFFAIAQSNYKPGYVVTPKGDTIKGFIDYRAWDASPASITFKPSLTYRDKKTYTMANASAFGVNGLAAYQKFVVSISMDITNTLHLVSGRDTSFRIDTVFLKVLQKGKNLALYQYTDNFKTRFYISEAPAYVPAELILRLYYGTDAKGNSQTVNENTYQKQLFTLASEYNVQDTKLTNSIEAADYEKDDLLKIVSQINQISSGEFEKKYKQQPNVRFYVSGGVASTTTSSTSGSDYTLFGGTGSTSVLPFFAVGVDMLPDPDGRAEFKLDISVNPGQFNSIYKYLVTPFTQIRASYNQLGFFFTPQGMYNIYNGQSFKFYIGAGLMISYNKFSNAYFGAANGGNSGVVNEPYFFNMFGDGFLLKAGAKIGRNVEVFFAYYGSTDATRQGYFYLNSQPNEFGLSYILGK